MAVEAQAGEVAMARGDVRVFAKLGVRRRADAARRARALALLGPD